ncbi:MAG: hypothetical protein IPO09_00645 [Anaeromyxobacter sp.]|nr:hypothetical protein [Anaeromyxobacter sp.]MBL0278323.1 hypothetical protein [Anaeromyxobacter sp.]
MQPYVQSFLREPRERGRRVVIFLAAFVVLAYLPLDAHVRQGPFLDLVLLRVGWAAMLVAIGLVQPRLGPSGWDRLILLGAAASSACYVAIVALAGGLATPQAVWLPVMPLATVLLAWERYRAVGLSGLVTLAGTVALALWQGHGVAIWIGLVAGTICLAIGTSLAFLRVQLDEAAAVTSRDEAQARLLESERGRQRAERLAVAGRLAASVAHAVNSPLAAVKSNLHQLAERAGTGAVEAGERAEVVADTTLAVDQITRIVGALRIFSQDEWTAPSLACPVAPAVAEALREAGRLLPSGVAWRTDVEPGLPPVSAGEALLTQVLVGVLVSAGDGDRPGRPRQVSLEARRDLAGVRLDVVDDGPAFPAVVLAALLDVRAATWTPGRGVGLGLARELLSLEGGRLDVESRAEGGVRHRLWLPVAGMAPVPPPS